MYMNDRDSKWESYYLTLDPAERKKLLDEFGELKDKLIIAGGLNKQSLGELETLGIKKVLIGTSLHSGEVRLLD